MVGLVSSAGCTAEGPGTGGEGAGSSAAVSAVGSSSGSAGSTSSVATGSATPVIPPPYVDHVEWVQTAVGPSLQIHPTAAGRRTENPDGADIAWAEVLRLEPDADTPGMRAQFDCHWDFARAVEPDKPSWNIEPSRPVVTDQAMIQTRCNPGAPEE